MKFCTWECPSCRGALQVPIELLGKQAGCPYCRAVFRMPRSVPKEPMQEFLDWMVNSYIEWLPIEDGRTSENHLALMRLGLNGTNIFRRDDPAFAQYFREQAAGFMQCRCNCGVIPTSYAAERGVKEAQRMMNTERQPSKPQFVKLPFDPWGPGEQCEVAGLYYEGDEEDESI